MLTYRLRSDRDLMALAIEKGLRPSGYAIGNATDIPPQTINLMRRGRPPSNETMAALVTYFEVTVDDLFEVVKLPSRP